MEIKQYKVGEQITLSDKTTLIVEIRTPEVDCENCYYQPSVDCCDRLCSFDERDDRENIIFRRHE